MPKYSCRLWLEACIPLGVNHSGLMCLLQDQARKQVAAICVHLLW